MITLGLFVVKEPKCHKVEIKAKETSTIDVKDVPQADPVDVVVGKVDAYTNKNKPQGSASLEGAEFTIKYYTTSSSTDPAKQGIKPTAQWVVKTNDNGVARFNGNDLVSGNDFYYNSLGKVKEAYDEPWPEYEMVEHIACNTCQADLTALGVDEWEHVEQHWVNEGKTGGYHSIAVKVLTGYSTIHHDAEYSNQYVVDKAAYDETVTTGYKCSICGATKK